MKSRVAYFLMILLFASCSRGDIIQEPLLEKQDLFSAGENGYHTYRIPGLTVTKNGVLLAYCAARKGRGGDWDEIDVAMRRSLDGGKSWSSMKIIADVDTFATDNPVAIADYITGSVHFLFQSDYRRLYYLRSDDDGETFIRPIEITSVVETFKKIYPWVVQAPGPGHGIQLENGRLVVPFWLSDGGAKEFGPDHRGHRPSIVVAVYSDDHGETWKPGDVVAWNSDTIVVPSETSCVQLADGRVIFNMRNESPNYRRLISFSDDGATGWSFPVYHDAFFEPICFAGMTRISLQPHQSKNRILFSNPDSRMIPRNRSRNTGHFEYSAPGRARQNLTLRMSYDEGHTWPVKKVLEPGLAGYSDLAVLQDGSMVCFYENGGLGGVSTQTANLTLAKFNMEWLTDGKDHIRRSDQPFLPTFKK